MPFIVGAGSLLLIFAILLDAFETVLLPRRVTHGYRLARFFYRHSWRGWRQIWSPTPYAIPQLGARWACH